MSDQASLRRRTCARPATAALVLLAAWLAAAPAAAGGLASPWSDDHASRARLLDGGADAAGRLAGVEIDLAPGYRTYWRHAGDSGLPPEIDWSDSTNVAFAELVFPAPERFEDAGGAYFGYAEGVVLPLRVTPLDASAPMELRVLLEYGVCKEICIPARAEMALSLDADGARGHPAVAEALARAPRAVAFGEAGALGFDGIDMLSADRLAVRLRAPEGATLFAEGPDHRWFFDPKPRVEATGPGEGVVAVEIAARPREPAAAPVALRLTLVGGGDAVESVHMLDPAAIARKAD